MRSKAGGCRTPYEQFVGAWNAISFRYLTLCDEGDAYTAAIQAPNAAAGLEERYRQERHLFGFFSAGFSAFEAYFYGLFAIGAILVPAAFPLASPKEQQSVSPNSTNRTYLTAFAGDQVIAAFHAAFQDAAYVELKEVRNILTHRAAPGRTIFISVGRDNPPTRWKINDIALDQNTAASRRADVARLLGALLNAAATFVEARIP